MAPNSVIPATAGIQTLCSFPELPARLGPGLRRGDA
jgi:hypothetical protein